MSDEGEHDRVGSTDAVDDPGERDPGGSISAQTEQEEEPTKEEQAMAKLKEAIAVDKEPMGALRLKLTVTVPVETLDERRTEQFADLKREAQIPGFRKGRAPLRLVEKRFASDVGDKLKSQLISDGYQAAVEKEGLKPLGDPLFWVQVEEERVGQDRKSEKVKTEKLLPFDQAFDRLVFPKEGPLTFSCEVDLRPEFDLPELKNIPVKRPKVSIDDDDVEAELKRMRTWRGTYRPVEAGRVESDDLLYADMTLSVDGQVVASEENLELRAHPAVVVHGVALDGFADAVAGKGLNDSVVLDAPVPEDHDEIDIRGKSARFEFEIREIKRLHVPPIDDLFLEALGFDSEAELRAFVRSSLESRLDATITEAMRGQISRYLVDRTGFEVPERLSQRQTDRAVARRRIELYREGLPETEIDKEVDAWRVQARDRAVHDLKLLFILAKIAEERDIRVTEEQMNAAIAQIAQRTNRRFDRVRDELSRGDGLLLLATQLRDQQVLDALLDDADITETEGPKKATTPTGEEATPHATTGKKDDQRSP